MARALYQPDVNKFIYHYTSQIGQGSPFVGHYRQLGYGLGALFSGLGRMLLKPLTKQAVKRVIKTAARKGARTLLSKPAQKAIKSAAKQGVKRVLKRGATEALATGVDILSDVVTKRRSLKDSAKIRAAENIKRMLEEKPKRAKAVRRTKKRRKDIFD